MQVKKTHTPSEARAYLHKKTPEEALILERELVTRRKKSEFLVHA